MTVLAFTTLSGCGGDEPKRNLSKIAGIIHVDGVPAVGVTLTLHPNDGSGSVSTGISRDGGTFEVSTFEAGDGAAPGEYKVTFTWGDYDPLTRSQKGDRLNGRYASSNSTPVQWSVQPLTLNNLGIVDLTTR
jgi:hypothetical protein